MENPVNSEKASFISELYRGNEDLQLVRDQVLNVLIAGRDTTAATLSYAFHLVLRNPSVLETFRCEIHTVFGPEKDIKRAHIQRMPYLHNVLQEVRNQIIPGFPHLLTEICGPSIVSSGSDQYTFLQEDDYSPLWRCSGRTLAAPRSRRDARRIFSIPHSTAEGYIWT